MSQSEGCRTVMPWLSRIGEQKGAPKPGIAEGLSEASRTALDAAGCELRELRWNTDTEAVLSFQSDTYTLNFPGFQVTQSFLDSFRYDLREATRDPNHGLYVLTHREEVVGFLWLIVHTHSWYGGTVGYINNLYVAEGFRGQGLGEVLMEQAEAFFRARGVGRATLTVTCANEAAVNLYLKAGYQIQRYKMEKDFT